MSKKISAVILIVMMVIETGCSVPRKARPYKGKEYNPLPDRYSSYYDYSTFNESGSIIANQISSNFTVTTVEIPLSMPVDWRSTPFQDIEKEVSRKIEKNPEQEEDLKLLYLNRIEIYKPKGLSPEENLPTILISPILGGNMIVDRFAKYYAKHNFIAAIVHRKEIYWNQDEGVEQIENYLRMSIVRLRQALNWLSAQPNVDSDRIGAFGISYGAIMHSILAAVDDRIKYHILAMPAAPLPEVIVDCGDPQIKEIIPVIMQQYGDHATDELQRRLHSAIMTDPILMGSAIERDQMLFYIALFDRVVGTRRSFSLWKAFNKPKLKVLPFGHYGGILALPLLKYQTRKAFEKELG